MMMLMIVFVLTLMTYKEGEGFLHHLLEARQQQILGKRSTSGLCVCTWLSRVCSVLCVSVRPSLKSPASGWIEGSGSDFPRKWQEETRGFRPLWLLHSHKTTHRREGRVLPHIVLPSAWKEKVESWEERLDAKTWDRRLLPGFGFGLVWRWSLSSELWVLCCSAARLSYTHWILLGRTSAAASGTVLSDNNSENMWTCWKLWQLRYQSWFFKFSVLRMLV